MNIAQEKVAETVILSISGQIDGKTAKAFEERVNQVLAEETGGLIIDCADLAFISSAGLRVFLIAAKKLKPQRRSLIVCSLQPLVAEIFQTTGLPGILTVRPDRAQALVG